ncbi:hypothetical protein NL676_029393 [Syzygium grande]|nr:hypothetical protein NL676_029393 [Syzygium grande]
MAIPKNEGVPTVVHLRGGINPSQSDGHALAWFTANFAEMRPTWTQQTYTYPNTQHAGNLWYHDHAVGLTRVNLLAGLIAPYIRRNVSLDARLNLPLDPVFDWVLMIFDRSFNADGSLYINAIGDNPTIHPQWQPEYFGDTVIVNDKAWPYLQVQRRRYRFHIINTSNAKYCHLSLTNNLTFTQIGSDGSYLPNPVGTQTILLSPAEGAYVVVDFSMTAANETVLTDDAAYPYPSSNPVDQLNGKTGISTYLYINGLRFEDLVTETPRVGTTEIWEVINLTGDNHPFHMHLAAFQAVKIQQLVDLAGFTSCVTRLNNAISCNITGHATGLLVDVPLTERTWKNGVKIAPGYKTTLMVQFFVVDNAYSPYPFNATAEPAYVYHCHVSSA